MAILMECYQCFAVHFLFALVEPSTNIDREFFKSLVRVASIHNARLKIHNVLSNLIS